MDDQPCVNEKGRTAEVLDMKSARPPFKVFVDTSVLHSHYFDWNNRRLQELASRSMGKGSAIEWIMPSIIDAEIRKKLRNKVADSRDVIESAKRKSQILRQIDLPEIKAFISEWNWERIEASLLYQYETYIAEAHAVRFAVNEKNLRTAIKRFEHGTAPFGEGKKQCEFVDALACAALIEHGKAHSNSIIVLSNDGDFARACQESPWLVGPMELDELLEMTLPDPWLSKPEFGRQLTDALEDLERVCVEEYVAANKYIMPMDGGPPIKGRDTVNVQTGRASWRTIAIHGNSLFMEAKIWITSSTRFELTNHFSFLEPSDENETYLQWVKSQEWVRMSIEVPVDQDRHLLTQSATVIVNDNRPIRLKRTVFVDKPGSNASA